MKVNFCYLTRSKCCKILKVCLTILGRYSGGINPYLTNNRHLRESANYLRHSLLEVKIGFFFRILLSV